MTTKLNRRRAKQIIKDALKSVKEYRKEHVTVNKPYETIQRNEDCPCESGLKYKKCCLKRLNDKEQSVYEDIHTRERLIEAIKKDKRKAIHGNTSTTHSNSPLILPDNVRNSEIPKIIIP